MNNIALGQYLPLNSIVHRMDPRAKIAAMLIVMIAIFIPAGYSGYAVLGIVVCAVAVLARLRLSFVWRAMRPMLFMLVFLLIVNLLVIHEGYVLFSIGTRFSDRVTSKISDFAKHAKIVHIDIDSSSISRNIVVDVPIVADAKEAIQAMLRYVKEADTAEWMNQIHAWADAHPLHMKKGHGITPEAIIQAINEHKENAIVVTDVGQHQMWTTQYLQMDASTRLLTSGGMGTMGYGLPGAVGAQLANPDKTVFCITGDGGMQMNIQEMATAVAEELPIVICIFNNHYLGMVRQMQALFYRRHYSGVCTRRRKTCPPRCGGPSSICPDYTPDFVKLADSYGCLGLRVQEEDQIKPALEQALANKKGPTIIEFVIACDDLVFPMVQGGKALNDMILDC